MATQKVLVLGGSGMLGNMIIDVLAANKTLTLAGTARPGDELDRLQKNYPHVTWHALDAEQADEKTLGDLVSDYAWVINAIGIIKPYIHDDNPQETERALRVNALFPHILAKAGLLHKRQIIQIATDCVYSGRDGHYTEKSPHDALDVYGKSKSLGEVHQDSIHHLRCSIIGPERKAHLSLLDWFLNQPQDATVKGFTNHQWNGVTTYHYARICEGIIVKNLALGHLQHIVPTDTISKADLLKSFAKAFGREDITITLTEAEVIVDRTLATQDEAQNQEIWHSAGYDVPPTVPQMVIELATHTRTMPKE